MPLNALSYNTLFIDEPALKAQGLINENVDMKILTPVINLVQRKYLTLVLGTGLYVYLQNSIINSISPGTIPPDGGAPTWGYNLQPQDTQLLNIYIQPLLVWAIQAEAPIYITYKMMNLGVQKQDSDNSKPASLDEVQMLANQAKANRDWYASQLIKYIITNQNLFPSYYRIINSADTAPTARPYRSGIYLGNGYDDQNAADPRWYFR